ncbi:MAG TPA: hypothetical protein VF190_03790 [Rhodothermales bacterium]
MELGTLEVQPLSWDSLRVEVGFAERGIGPPRPVDVDSVVFRLFDGEYQTLYEGTGPVVPVPDSKLGDRERLVLEACGTLHGTTVCDQRMLQASPKRVTFREDLTYPRDGRYDRGDYSFAFRLERQAFEGGQWEELPGTPMTSAYLVASVDGDTDTSVRVPISAAGGEFDLSRYENYATFDYRMRRALERRDAVPVQIEVYAGLDGEAGPLATLERIVREKSREEREEEMERFVQLAAERLLERFEPYDDGRAYVRRWAFDEDSRRYEVRLRLTWGHLFFGRRVVDGELSVGEDGSDAVFTQHDLNREARRPWRQRIGRDRVALGTLEWESPETDLDPDESGITRRL